MKTKDFGCFLICLLKLVSYFMVGLGSFLSLKMLFFQVMDPEPSHLNKKSLTGMVKIVQWLPDWQENEFLTWQEKGEINEVISIGKHCSEELLRCLKSWLLVNEGKYTCHTIMLHDPIWFGHQVQRFMLFSFWAPIPRGTSLSLQKLTSSSSFPVEYAP